MIAEVDGDVMLGGDEIEAMPDELGGAGDVVWKRSLKFDDLVAETGCGAANCVEDVVVDVVGGGERTEASAEPLVAAGAAGVADWKSSKSSSPLAGADDSMSPKSSKAAAFPFEVVTGSSAKSNKSCSGSFFFNVSILPAASLLIVLTEAARGSFLLDVAGVSSSSSYSSNRSPLLELSEKLVS